MKYLVKYLFLAFVIIGLSVAAYALTSPPVNLPITITPSVVSPYPLKVANGQLQTASGAPFFLVGDSAYAAVAVAPPTGNGGANMTSYFSNLQAKGFNASLEFGFQIDSLTGNAYDGTAPFTATLSGCTPTGTGTCWDLTTPNAAYWNQVVNMVNLAAQYGIVIQLGTIDGGCTSTGGLQLLANNGSTRASNFGAFLGNTFKNIPNIYWYHGDDYSCFNNHTYDDPMFAMAQGIQSAGDTHLQTMELCGPFPFGTGCAASGPGMSFPTSLDDTTNNWASVIGLNLIYHYGTTFEGALHAYNQSPTTPAFFGEIDWAGLDNTGGNTGSQSGCQNDTQIATAPYCPIRQRQEEWFIATSGGYWGGMLGRPSFGPYYNLVYPSTIPAVPDTQYVYLANFMRSIPWYKLQPSPGGSGSIVTAGYGSNASGTTLGSNYVTSSLASDGSLAVAYLPDGNSGPITVNMALMETLVTAKWYDPTADSSQTGSYATICSPSGPVCGTGSQNFTSPFTHSDGTHDAVLLLQASPTGGPTITSVSLSPSSFLSQTGDANSTVGTLSTVVSAGSFGGTYSLAPSGACTGADNARFAISGSLLKINTADQLFGGPYSLCVRASDASFANSPKYQSITVTGASPFGTVLAENYDVGGQGVGYNVPSPSSNCLQTSSYRSDTVNFNTSTSGPAYQLGCNLSPDWYNYTVNITGTGPYNITANLGSASAGGSWGVYLDSASIGTIATPNTGSYNTFQQAGLSASFSATAGNHVLQFRALGGDAFSSSGDFLSFLQGTPALSITSASISPSSPSYTSGAASGTVIGNLSATLSTGTFTGTWSTSGTAAADFSANVGNQLKTNGSTPTCSSTTVLNLNIVATQSGAGGSPFTQAITVTCNPVVVAGAVACNPSNLSPGIPSQASAVGYTTLINCWDFTQQSVVNNIVNGGSPQTTDFRNTANWLDCAGAATPQWFLGGVSGSTITPCSRVSVGPDPNGSGQTFAFHWDGNDVSYKSDGSVYSTLNQMESAPNYANTGITSGGELMQQYVYYEATVRVVSPNSGYFSFWLYCGGTCEEYDTIEWYNSNNFSDSAMHDWGGGGGADIWFGSDVPNFPNWDTSQYHTYGSQITRSGSGVQMCTWIDNQPQGCVTNTVHGPTDGSLIFLVLNEVGQNSGSTSSPLDRYSTTIRVFSCANWRTQACN